jgi:hypothetical protein
VGRCGRIGLTAALLSAQPSQVAAMIQRSDGSSLAASSGPTISGAFDSRRHAWGRRIDPARRPSGARRCDRRILHRQAQPSASHEDLSPTALASRAALSEAASHRTIPLRRWIRSAGSAIFRLDHGVGPRPCSFPPGRAVEARAPPSRVLPPSQIMRRRLSVCSATFRYPRSDRAT